MIDPKELAQREGPDMMEALVQAAYGIAEHGPDGLITAHELILAARRLALPEPPKPVWPTGPMWARFRKQDGAFLGIDAQPYDITHNVPIRVVPADTVVLTAEQAKELASEIAELNFSTPVFRRSVDVLRGKAT